MIYEILKILIPKRIEYILEGNLLEKSVKRPFCCTAGVLHIFMLYNLLGPGISFYRKSKINVKRKPIYEKGWCHNWPMIISLYKRWFSVKTINQMMLFIHLIHYKVYLTALKISKMKWIV